MCLNAQNPALFLVESLLMRRLFFQTSDLFIMQHRRLSGGYDFRLPLGHL